MLADLTSALRHPGTWIYSAWVTFLIKYRKTSLGPLWIIVGPATFVLALGELFRNVTAHADEMFVPHLAAGLIIWNYLVSIVQMAPRLYVINRPFLLHGPTNHFNIILRIIANAVIVFLHQAIIIVVVMVLHKVPPSPQLLLAIPAALLLLIHSIWILVVLGILGARYRDLAEVVEMAMRIAFLATPIIWMPGDSERGSIVGVYLAFNPFYHALEPLRGAILGTPVPTLSWIISSIVAVLGTILAATLYRRFRHLVVLWT